LCRHRATSLKTRLSQKTAGQLHILPRKRLEEQQMAGIRARRDGFTTPLRPRIPQGGGLATRTSDVVTMPRVGHTRIRDSAHTIEVETRASTVVATGDCPWVALRAIRSANRSMTRTPGARPAYVSYHTLIDRTALSQRRVSCRIGESRADRPLAGWRSVDRAHNHRSHPRNGTPGEGTERKGGADG